MPFLPKPKTKIRSTHNHIWLTLCPNLMHMQIELDSYPVRISKRSSTFTTFHQTIELSELLLRSLLRNNLPLYVSPHHHQVTFLIFTQPTVSQKLL